MTLDGAIIAFLTLLVAFFYSHKLWTGSQKEWRSTRSYQIDQLYVAEEKNVPR